MKILHLTLLFLLLSYFSANLFSQRLEGNLPAILPSPEKIELKEGYCCIENLKNIQEKRDKNIAAEGYILNISRKGILIFYADANGLIYAKRTLDQLKFQYAETKKIPCMLITDSPRLRWRSFMLDSGRQYQSVVTIKKYIEMASLLKMNRFHWHLTEGLGWRVEIKKYPELTARGAFVGSAEGQQGFYTQEEIREIVQFAADLGISIVPEIDLPGHSEAALNAYPLLGCLNIRPTIPEAGFTANIMCAGKEQTLLFLKDVIDELCELFPFEYIHLGGDEAPKDIWEKCTNCQARIEAENLEDTHQLQQWFSSELANHLKAKERKAIFWGDIILLNKYKLPDNVAIQWWNWRGHKDQEMRNALENGHEVICSTNFYTYLNMPTSPLRGYGKERTFSLSDAYNRNPSYLPDNTNPLILGMNCSLWTDYGVTEELIDGRVFPRIFALAEQMWHNGVLMEFSEFERLINAKKSWFNHLGYVYNN